MRGGLSAMREVDFLVKLPESSNRYRPSRNSFNHKIDFLNSSIPILSIKWEVRSLFLPLAA